MRKLILVEGIDGAGKSTYVQFLKEKYNAESVAFPRQVPKPGSLKTHGEKVNYYLKDFEQEPLLKSGQGDLVSDRSFITTYVYQGLLGPKSLNYCEYIARRGMEAFFGKSHARQYKPEEQIELEVIHVLCSPEEAIRRMNLRAKSGQGREDDVERMKEGDRLEYLTTLDKAFHEAIAFFQTKIQSELEGTPLSWRKIAKATFSQVLD